MVSTLLWKTEYKAICVKNNMFHQLLVWVLRCMCLISSNFSGVITPSFQRSLSFLFISFGSILPALFSVHSGFFLIHFGQTASADTTVWGLIRFVSPSSFLFVSKAKIVHFCRQSKYLAIVFVSLFFPIKFLLTHGSGSPIFFYKYLCVLALFKIQNLLGGNTCILSVVCKLLFVK